MHSFAGLRLLLGLRINRGFHTQGNLLGQRTTLVFQASSAMSGVLARHGAYKKYSFQGTHTHTDPLVCTHLGGGYPESV